MNATISMMTKLMMVFPMASVGSFPGIPRHPTTKIETIMMPVVTKSNGRRGILFANSTAARTTKTWMRNTMSVMRNGSSSPILLLNTVPK